MIILEGADGVGKTTAARQLQQLAAEVDVKLGYRHMSKPPDDFDHVQGYVSDVSARVQDRYHLGAIVYGQMLGYGGFPTARRMRLVQRYLRWQGAVVVVMHAQRDWLREKIAASTKAEMYDAASILDANDAYKALVRTTNGGVPYADAEIDVTRGWATNDDLRSLLKAWSERWNG